MSGGANIVEQYAGADVPARIELLIKYYPNFIRLVEGYEPSLSRAGERPVIGWQSTITKPVFGHYGEIFDAKVSLFR